MVTRSKMKELINGFYATRIYLPLSSFSRWWKRARRKNDKFLQDTKLPETSWKNCTPHRAVKIWDKKANGNIRISELAIINSIAKSCEKGSNIFEIGTFDGRTSLNISFSVPAECNVFTLDLLPNKAPLFSLASGERHMVEKQQSGARLENMPIPILIFWERSTNCMGIPQRLIFRHSLILAPWCSLMVHTPMII